MSEETENLLEDLKKVKVIIFRRPNMLKVQSNPYNLVGFGALQSMFTDPDYKAESDSLSLYYPERFLNIIEQRVLIHRIIEAGFEEATILTSSVYIVQTTNNVRIYGDKHIDESRDTFKLSNDYAGLPEADVLSFVGAVVKSEEK